MTPAICALPPNMQNKIRMDGACWTWTGAITSAGYGSVGYHGRVWSTHRLAYELLVGPIPLGLHADHLCENKRCCNPAHLEPVTGRENVLRAIRKDTCLRGHQYTPENTIWKKGGAQRNCRTCANKWQRNYRAARRETAA